MRFRRSHVGEFEHAVDQARRVGFDLIRIEADPNAEGFYERMGAKRVGTNLGEVEGEKRELPLMEYRDFAGRTNSPRAL